MGGPGSGRESNAGTRLTVEDCLSMPLSLLRKHGLLSARAAAHRLAWQDEQGTEVASVNVLAHMDDRGESFVRLQYRVGVNGVGRHVDQRVSLNSTMLSSGGSRAWYSCPACGRRAGVLHLPPGEKFFACRACHDLSYRSRWRA